MVAKEAGSGGQALTREAAGLVRLPAFVKMVSRLRPTKQTRLARL